MNIVTFMGCWYVILYWELEILFEHFSVIFTAIGMSYGFFIVILLLSCFLQSCWAG
jgi:hypothetical protein